MTTLIRLPDRPFTTAEAKRLGVSDAMLRSRHFRRLFRGVYVAASSDLTFAVRLLGALLVLPTDAVASHLTALRVYGLEIGAVSPLHISTQTSTHTRHEGIRSHQRRAPISRQMLHGIPVTSPNRTLIDITTKVGLVQVVQAAEWMIHQGLTSREALATYATERHLDGVRRMRRIVGLVRDGVESPMESLLRLMIVFARLPEPRCNVDIRDALGRFVARGDLVYPELKVLIEYDGWHHERDGRQRQHDLVRRERLEAEGWRVIVVTAEDMKDKRAVVRRVHAALTARGYAGATPQFNDTWSLWFA